MSTSHRRPYNGPGPSSPADNRKRRQFKGVRQRKGRKWVSEVRIPNCKEKIWLGSYDTAEQAARAFDAATYCLRGPLAQLNFPDSLPAIPFPSSLSPQQIQQAAANYAVAKIPSAKNSSNSSENATAPPLQSPRLSVGEREGGSDASEFICDELDSAMWDSFFADSDYDQSFDVKNFPFLEPSTAPQEPGSSLLHDIRDIARLKWDVSPSPFNNL